ncbi:MAG: tetratricopeptide repeat protein [Saprospiraceae bacterium]|nr:tetratricopeptide repeat protein [Saprospiraceae bacterium]
MKPSFLLIASVLLFIILFFGFSKIPPEVRNPEKSGVSEIENVDLLAETNLIRDSLNPNDRDYLDLMEKQVEAAPDDSSKRMGLQQLSAYWYRMGYIKIAAEYALRIAKLYPSGETWSIAASNFVLAARQETLAPEKKSDAVEKAKAAFLQASQVDSANLNHRINYALLCTDFPSKDQPMEGILQLRELNERYPENVPVLYHLARLAVQTNQWDRAKERLTTLLTLDPGHQRGICLMATVAKQEGDKKNEAYWSAKCQIEN